MAGDHEGRGESSPATRLLDALGRGDLNAALMEFRPTTIVRTEDRTWSLQGEDDVLGGLSDALDLFPGLVFDSHARHIGHGQVIEEARVRDLGPLDQPDDSAHDTPAGATSGGGSLVLDRDQATSNNPRLNMPLRMTVLHDDRFVHEIILSFPRALFRSALGLHVDPLDLAVSEIQSAFVAPVGSGFTTHQMGSKPAPALAFGPPTVPEPEPEPEPVVPVAAEPEPEPEPAAEERWRPAPPVVEEVEEEAPRRRALVVVPLIIVLVAGIAGGTWWLGRDNNAAEAGPNRRHASNSASQNGNKQNKPTKKPSTGSPSPSDPVTTKTDKPTVTLKSDLAFAKNSAALSDAAKQAIADIADQVRSAQLHGTIYIHGYTDNLGSAEYGLALSQDRASAVAQYLRSRLNGYDIDITALGHGEADPIASNATEAGRQKNRRVTITLPKN